MPSDSLKMIVRQLRAAAGRDGIGPTDGELLTHFLGRRDEEAFALIVERHAPMVWGVCRRLLANPHDAEDAFQATFLVLVQKAATVVPREMLANWLYGVARQTAVRLRSAATKRGWREMQVNELPEPAVTDARDEELFSRLDEELRRLPERFRALIVLCDLEGRTRREAARQLGCPEGTVASGLVRARERLAKRLTRSGLAVSGASLAATLSHSMASADVPATCLTSTINVATLLMAGKATGVISGPVATLTQGVLKTMFLKKIMTTVTVLALGVAVITGGSLAVGQGGGRQTISDAKTPMVTAPEQPIAPTEKTKSPPRNQEWSGKWRGEKDGMTIEVVLGDADEARWTINARGVNIQADLKREPGPGLKEGLSTGADLNSTDKACLRFRSVENPKGNIVGTLEKGGGETLMLEILPEATKIWEYQAFGTVKGCRLSKVTDGETEREALTAWGKEVGGLQAGLGYLPGKKRVYHTGEEVTVVLRVRNVGKEEVRFRHFSFKYHPPAVTDGEGKTFPAAGPPLTGSPNNMEVTLAPGKSVDLTSSSFRLRPDSEKDEKSRDWKLFGTGKFQLHLVRPVWQDEIFETDSILSKLATGKLELEVKEPEKAPQDKKEPLTAWGKEAGGLQAGLAVAPGRERHHQPGERVAFEFRLRNVGKEAVTITYGVPHEHAPKINDSNGREVRVTMPPMMGYYAPPINRVLKPAETMTLFKNEVAVEPEILEKTIGPEALISTPTIRVGPGTYHIAIGGLLQSHPKLSTGTVEFEVKPAKDDRLTAWGKEAGGLQAGLGLPPGAKRVYQPGETVTLLVRVRNVGKETVTFEYVRQFLDENRPVVTDAGGKAIPQSGTSMLGMHGPTEVTLKPGMEIVLETRMHGASGSPHALLPEGGGVSSAKTWPLFVGTGKVGLQYERVIGNSSSGFLNKLDPALSKLATGKLELEIAKSETEVQPKPVAAPGKEAGDAEKKSPPEQDRKAKAEVFTIKNVKIEEVDEKAGVVSVSFGDKQRPTRLTNLPLGKGVRVVASHVLPGVGNNLPFDWKRVDGLKGRIVSIRLTPVADRLEVVSIAFGND